MFNTTLRILIIFVGSLEMMALDLGSSVLQWRFDNPHSYGDIEYDVSGHSNNGIIRWERLGSNGGLRWKPVDGFFKGSAYLPRGVRGTISTQKTLSLPNNWTISLLFKPLNDKTRFDNMISFHCSDDTKKNILSFGQNHRFRINLDTYSQQQTLYFFKDKMSSMQWNHLLIVYETEQVTFYLNGKSQTVKHSSPWNPSTKFKLSLSGRNGSPHHRSEGDFDEFRIYGRALDTEEINQLASKDFYQKEKSIPIADPGMGYTTFLEDGMATIKMQGREMHSSQNAGATHYKWELLNQPKGAKGRFANVHQADTTFSANKAGDYEFQLTVSNAAGSDSAIAKGAFFIRDRTSKRSKLYERNDHEQLRSFGFEAPNPKRAEALAGKSMPLIAHWSFDEGAGQSVNATGPRGSKLTLNTNVRFAEGRHGSALDLRHIKKPSLDLGTFPEMIDDVSVSFWMYHDLAPKKGFLVAAKGEQANYWEVKFRKGDGIHSHLLYKWHQGSSKVHLAKRWVHCIVSFNAEGGIRKMYIDGEQHVWEREAVNIKASGSPRLVFGSRCIIDDLAIYNKTLNHEEAWALFKANGDASTVTKRVAQDPYQQAAFRNGVIKRYYPEEDLKTQLNGFAAERFDGSKTPPYTHPRVIFTMEDLPRLRKAARLQREGVSNFTTVHLFTNTAFGDDLSKLKPIASRREPSNKKGIDVPGSHIKVDTSSQAGGQILAAYRVLMTADSKGARKIIDSMMTAAKLQREKIDAVLKVSDSWQMYYHDSLGRRATPLIYDYLYNWMTINERRFIRKLIADATAQKFSIGMYGAPANHTSNWEPWLTGDLNMALEAISGEEGYDYVSHAAAKRAQSLSVIHMNDPESGAHSEPMGKSNLGATQSAVVSRSLPLESKIVASKAYYNMFTKFMFYNGFPWTNKGLYEFGHHGGFLNGGLDRSLRVIHYAYPDDPMLNYLKHSYEGGDTGKSRLNPRTYAQESWAVALTMPQDWTGPDNITAHRQQVIKKLDLPLGYFSDFRGQMTSYSDWSRDALQLFFVPRNQRVGHSQAIRGMFAINALGRQWVIGRTYDHNDGHGSIPAKNSVITVDGKAGDTSAAKLLFYSGASEHKGATFDILSSDLTACYRQIDNNWPSLNHTKLHKNNKRPWMDLPVKAIPSPLSNYRVRQPINLENLKDIELDSVQSTVPFEHAHRTAVLARGKYPYVLIVDDIKKDSKQRSYVWNAPLAEDIMAAKSWVFKGNSAIISNPKDTSNELMIQILGSNGSWGITPVHSSKKGDLTDMLNLTYTAVSDRAEFKALIYPRKKGDPTPYFHGSDGNFTITIGDQHDELNIKQQMTIKRK
ncbi:hypothetical protein PQO01_06815 [Lentisphaera marina]|uniref:LamG-like jellyroll fold domain-containing protein n=1 Tax=Lentisphaera marina TaxID=1111041 RepID=UPI002365A8A1|nr:LamG-like jellyroll fold domain-containing protein [Lentisphaera marina]MDD7984659.1 hypothetical protein [Lentisphaera marina]